jgi:hypothetical protein
MIPSISTPLLRRPLGLFVLAGALVALGLLLLAPAGAPARTTRARPTGCQAAKRAAARRAGHRAAARGCAKHAAPKPRRHARKPASKKAEGATPAVELAPAGCEDGSAPTRSATAFSCEDGSAPVCDDGSAPTRVSRSGAPLCPVLTEGAESEALECAPDASGECATVEWTCKDTREPEEPAQPCEIDPPVEAED